MISLLVPVRRVVTVRKDRTSTCSVEESTEQFVLRYDRFRPVMFWAFVSDDTSGLFASPAWAAACTLTTVDFTRKADAIEAAMKLPGCLVIEE